MSDLTGRGCRLFLGEDYYFYRYRDYTLRLARDEACRYE